MTAKRAARAIFVTTGVYTQEAKDFAKGNPIELVDGETLARLIAPIRGQVPVYPAGEAILQMSPEGSSAVEEAPSCPVCRYAMVLRTARKGADAGSEFLGCSNFPGAGEPDGRSWKSPSMKAWQQIALTV